MAGSRRRAGKSGRKRGAPRSRPRARVSTSVPAERGSLNLQRKPHSRATRTLAAEKLTSLSNEARQAVAAAFDAFEHWQLEILAANERCLTKSLDQLTNAHRALGWPEQVTDAAKEHFLKASNIQLQMIEQAMDLWQQQLKAQNARPGASGPQLQVPTASQFAIPTSAMMRFGEMTLTPFKLWVEAAQAWQRAWIAAVSGGALPEPPSIAKDSFAQELKPSEKESRPTRS